MRHRLRRRCPRPTLPFDRHRRPRRPGPREAPRRGRRRRPHLRRHRPAHHRSPPAIFGEGNGVVSAVRAGRRPDGGGRGGGRRRGPRRWSSWRTPPTDESAARRAGPVDPTRASSQLLSTDVAAPTTGTLGQRAEPLGDAGARTRAPAYRLRRRIDATTDGTYVVSCSFRTIVHKGLVAADALGRLLPRPGRRALRRPLRRLPPALLDQHAADLGAGPAVPACSATTARSTPSAATRTACGPGPGSAPTTAGLGPEDALPTGARPGRLATRACSTRPSSCSCAAVASVGPRHGHGHARGVGGGPRPRPRGPRLLRVPLRPDGAVGRPGRRDLHRRHRRRRRARPQRAATAALRALRGRPGRVRLGDGRRRRRRATARVERGRLGPGPHAAG